MIVKKRQGELKNFLIQVLYFIVGLIKHYGNLFDYLRWRLENPVIVDYEEKHQRKDKKAQQQKYNRKKMSQTSNQVMLQTVKSKDKRVQKRTYYIPVYLRLKLKHFISIDLINLGAEINADIIITFVYENKDHLKLPKELAKKLFSGIVLNFGRDDPLRLTEEDNGNITVKQIISQNASQISFTVRKNINVKIQSDVFWTPIQRIFLILPITVQPIGFTEIQTQRQQNGPKIEGQIKFNLMDHTNHFIKVGFSSQTSFGNYSLVQSQVNSLFSNQRIQSVDDFQKKHFYSKSKKGLYFQYCFIKLPIFKHPIVSLVTIFLPLWTLAALNMGIYYQDQNLAGRLASIAGLMVAFIALIPTIRSQIPPHPNVVFVEYLVYVEILASFLAFMSSLKVRNQTGFVFKWKQDNFFLASLAILGFQVACIVIMVVTHYFVLLPVYQVKNKASVPKFQHKYWGNKNCDEYFKTIIKSTSNLVKQLPQQPKQSKQQSKKSLRKLIQEDNPKPFQNIPLQQLLNLIHFQLTSKSSSSPTLSTKDPQETHNNLHSIQPNQSERNPSKMHLSQPQKQSPNHQEPPTTLTQTTQKPSKNNRINANPQILSGLSDGCGFSQLTCSQSQVRQVFIKKAFCEEDGDLMQEKDGDLMPEEDGDLMPEEDGDLMPEEDGDLIQEEDGDLIQEEEEEEEMTGLLVGKDSDGNDREQLLDGSMGLSQIQVGKFRDHPAGHSSKVDKKKHVA